MWKEIIDKENNNIDMVVHLGTPYKIISITMKTDEIVEIISDLPTQVGKNGEILKTESKKLYISVKDISLIVTKFEIQTDIKKFN